MFYRISQHSTFLYLMNPKFTKVGIIEDQLIDLIYPAGTIYQKLGHRDGAFFSDSKMRTSFHPRLQQCLDGISVQERYCKRTAWSSMNDCWHDDRIALNNLSKYRSKCLNSYEIILIVFTVFTVIVTSYLLYRLCKRLDENIQNEKIIVVRRWLL